jgi:hypothetical protein
MWFGLIPLVLSPVLVIVVFVLLDVRSPNPGDMDTCKCNFQSLFRLECSDRPVEVLIVEDEKKVAELLKRGLAPSLPGIACKRKRRTVNGIGQREY